LAPRNGAGRVKHSATSTHRSVSVVFWKRHRQESGPRAVHPLRGPLRRPAPALPLPSGV